MENDTSILGIMYLGNAILGNDGKGVKVADVSLAPNPVNTNDEYKITIDIKNTTASSVLGEMILGQAILGYSE